MRIIICGTGPFAVPTLEWLLSSPHVVETVLTRPIADSGRRRKTAANPVRDLAVAQGLEVLDPHDINQPDIVGQLRDRNADLLFVCDYGQILSAECLSATRLGGINLHGSLLPRYRGAAPINWAIYQGESETGVSVIHMSPRLDAGPILSQLRTAIGPDETAGELEPRLAALGVEAVQRAIEVLQRWNGQDPIGRTQDPNLVSRAPRLTKQQGRIDWSRTAEQIRNQVRAFQPWPGSWSEWHPADRAPVRIIFHRVEVVSEDANSADLDLIPGAAPGTIVLSDPERLWIQTGEGVIGVRQLQPAGRKALLVDAFQRGYPIRPGDRFAG